MNLSNDIIVKIFKAFAFLSTTKRYDRKKTTKTDKIFTLVWHFLNKCQIDGEDFINFCGLLRKHELYSSEYIKTNFKFKTDLFSHLDLVFTISEILWPEF